MTLFLLILSGFTPNKAWASFVFYLAFILPIILGLSYIILSGKLYNRSYPKLLKPGGRVLLSLNLSAPAISAVMLAAYLTTVLMTALGYEASPGVYDNFPLHILTSALLPALLEETLYRYIPMKLLLPENGRMCVILSAVSFSLIHLDLFKMPYALTAGLIFILIDIYAQSVIPSVIIHFMNNLLSLTVSYGYLKNFYPVGLTVTLSLLCAVSLAVVLIKRRSFKGFFSPLFSGRADC